MFLPDTWYAVAWDSEIKHAPFARTVCGEPIVLYRQMNGAISCFEDCCPHRLLPLSMGYLQGVSRRREAPLRVGLDRRSKTRGREQDP